MDGYAGDLRRCAVLGILMYSKYIPDPALRAPCISSRSPIPLALPEFFTEEQSFEHYEKSAVRVAGRFALYALRQA
jgi:hypothetical protein